MSLNKVKLFCAAAVTAAQLFLTPTAPAQSAPYAGSSSAALGSAIASLGTNTRVLVIAAHPDDEDTGLIAWLSRGRHVETAYLSLTRGDGGQNLIGNELGVALGVIRTQELLAARRIDGGKQFFTRAYDFGFSKDAEETLQHWPRDTILGDVVRIMRAYRPQVVVAFFSGTPRDGHGHHQVSGIFAREAYDLSADTVRFPVSGYGEPWTVSKFYRSARQNRNDATLRVNVGEYDPLSGKSYAEIAGASRSQHKSQGFGAAEPLGVVWSYLQREDSRVNSATPANDERSIFDGIDTTWAALAATAQTPGARAALDSAAVAFADARQLFRAESPTATVEPLARALRLLRTAQGTIADTPRSATEARLNDALTVTTARNENALLIASGVKLDALADRTELPVRLITKSNVDDSLPVRITLYNRGQVPVIVNGVAVTQGAPQNTITTGANVLPAAAAVSPDSQFTVVRTATARESKSPWWVSAGRPGDWFVAPVSLKDENTTDASTDIVATANLQIAGVPVNYTVPVVRRTVDAVRGQMEIPVVAVRGITIGLDNGIEYIRSDVPIDREFRVNVRSAYNSPVEVLVSLKLPAGLTADSAERTIVLPPNAGTKTLVFRAQGMVNPGLLEVGAIAYHEGIADTRGYYTIAYDHIPRENLYAPSGMLLSSVSAAVPDSLRVGYVPGVGDHGMEALRQLGVTVDRLEPALLGAIDLSHYQTIVVGPRAYDAQKQLPANNRFLLEWMNNGGNLVVQYGQYEMLQPGIMPYPIQLTRPASRVTVEEAPVRIINAASPLLTYPNRIGDDDFAAWVQERSTYMPSVADPRYETVLGMHDPGEPENPNSLLMANIGSGRYVYVTLALFRQLPAGIPGGARILLNLISPPAASAGQPGGGR